MSKNSIKNDEQVLELVYKINDNLKYKIDDNIVTIQIKQDHKIQKIFRKIKFKIPEYKNIELDEYCSYVFMNIDGKNSVKMIGELLSEKYGEDANPLYERLLLFINHIEVNEKYIERL